ncbi:MAG: RrF2 family transcriptional regulator [Acidobacteriota bacterium]
MKVSAQEEYGLRCMLQLARRQKAGTGLPLTLGEIARGEGLTVPYVAKLIRRMRRAGLVRSALGRSGGYSLSREADEISVGEILDALGGRLYDPDYCNRYSGDQTTCAHMGDCSIRSLWGVLETLLDGVLNRTKLADLVSSEQGMCAVLDGVAPRAVARAGR